MNATGDPLRLLLVGAGLANRTTAAPLARLIASQTGRNLVVHALDRGVIRADHLAHPGYRDATVEQSKAEALAIGLRRQMQGESGPGQRVTVHAWHGNLTRWPGRFFAGDLAVVGLDSEPARLAAQRLLRRSGTPAVVLGVSGVAGVFVLGPDPRSACYACTAQAQVPAADVPCLPHGGHVSTRAVAGSECLRWLAVAVPEICGDALQGLGLGTCHAFQPGTGSAVARIARDPGCCGAHETMVPMREVVDDLASVTLESLLGHAGQGSHASASFQGTFRDLYVCNECGIAERSGADLIREWPERERCGSCGSFEVQPRLALAGVSVAEARGRSWLGRTLRSLGTPPGGEVLLTNGDTALVLVRDRSAATEGAP